MSGNKSHASSATASDRLRMKAADVRQDVREIGSAARDMAHERIDAVKESAGRYYQQGRDKAQEVGENVESYIREKPMRSVLIAAGLGFLTGLILWRR